MVMIMIKGYKIQKLETIRLILDKGTIEDYLTVYEYDFGKLRDIDGVFIYEKYDSNEVRSWFKLGMKDFQKKSEKDHKFHWIIYLKEAKIPIGDLDADRENLNNNEIELSYNIHPSYWGNEYIIEALIAVINFLFELGYENVACSYSEGNNKSKRVCEKLGFDSYKIINNARIINGKAVTDYKTIMTKEKWISNNKCLIKGRKEEQDNNVKNLIAPCGMNCSLCISYIFKKHDLNKKGFYKSYCPGCINKGKNCTFALGKKCDQIVTGKIRFCYECENFPCDGLKRLDKRYKTKYNLSMIDNLNYIKEKGIEKFLNKEETKWKCTNCGELRCCHSDSCLICNIDELKDKKTK